MEDVRAVVNDYGVALCVNPMTDTKALVDLLRELGGVRLRPHAPTRILIEYGDGLTREIAKVVLRRRGVLFEETESAGVEAARRDPSLRSG